MVKMYEDSEIVFIPSTQAERPVNDGMCIVQVFVPPESEHGCFCEILASGEDKYRKLDWFYDNDVFDTPCIISGKAGSELRIFKHAEELCKILKEENKCILQIRYEHPFCIADVMDKSAYASHCRNHKSLLKVL